MSARVCAIVIACVCALAPAGAAADPPSASMSGVCLAGGVCTATAASVTAALPAGDVIWYCQAALGSGDIVGHEAHRWREGTAWRETHPRLYAWLIDYTVPLLKPYCWLRGW